ncbi:MAG TPA: hypothetical protein VEC12_06005, partial [Bacteroidia bacterium]|nr:hypothetical protein [Bacteroidia bacterium]
MAFEPDKITKDLIQKAVDKIENDKIQLIPSTGYDVIINNKAYPPKEIMRYAHELLNGERIWSPGGGKPTTKYFRKLGYEIVTKSGSVQPELTGNIWKLGAKWGSDAPSFYDFIKNERIVIGVKENYIIGDLVLICEGYTVKAIARVNEDVVPVTNREYEKIFMDLEIEYEDWVNYADAEWYELREDEAFEYKLRKGMERVIQPEIRKKAVEIWENRSRTINNLKNMPIMQAKNIILYGPPGTGKTYNSIDKAVEFATG